MSAIFLKYDNQSSNAVTLRVWFILFAIIRWGAYGDNDLVREPCTIY